MMPCGIRGLEWNDDYLGNPRITGILDHRIKTQTSKRGDDLTIALPSENKAPHHKESGDITSSPGSHIMISSTFIKANFLEFMCL